MNVFDYLFDSTQNLEKDFVLGSKETISFNKLYNDSLKIASYLKRNYWRRSQCIIDQSKYSFLFNSLFWDIKIR